MVGELVGGTKSVEKSTDKSGRRRFLHHENDERINTKGELKACFPFAPVIGRDNDPVFHGNLSYSCDEKFSSNDKGSDPDGREPRSREIDKGGADKNFVGEGVNEFAESSDHIEFACKVAIQPVACGSYDKGNKSHCVESDMANACQGSGSSENHHKKNSK